MYIAILTDDKGFTKTMQVPYPQPVIKIPLKHRMSIMPKYETAIPLNAAFEAIDFHFIKEEKSGSVTLLYYEIL